MKIIFVGIFICILLVSSTITLALTPVSRDEQLVRHQFFDPTRVLFPISKVWARTFGGTDVDEGWSAQQTTDGGYIMVGETTSYFSDTNVWLIKTNSNGVESWNRTFGGLANDMGHFVQQTTDGGFIIVGATYSFGAGGYDVWLIKTDGDGDKIWEKTFGGINYDCGWSVQQTIDGGYIIIANTVSFGAGMYDFWLIKTNGNGDAVWEKTFGGTASEYSEAVQQTSDGGYILIGSTASFGAGSSDVWLIKTDYNGNRIWDKTFGGVENDVGWSVQQTTDEGYIVTGFTYSFGAGNSDVWLIKTDSNGNKIWDKTFGGIEDDFGDTVQQTTDGGFIIGGSSSSFGAGELDLWLIKTNSQGKAKSTLLGSLWFERFFYRLFPRLLDV